MIDTSTLFSALINPQSVPRRAFNKATANGQLILSEQVFEEILEVLNRPKMRQYVNSNEISRFIEHLLKISAFFNSDEKVTICRDAKDNKFLELAVAGNAQFIISSDSDLQVLHPFRNVAIVSPSDFLVLNPDV